MQSLTVPGTLDSLSSIAQFVTAVAEEAGLAKKASYKLRLAVEELVVNSILHGYEEADIQGELDLKASIGESTLTISIEDTGVAYDPHQNQIPDRSELNLPLEERKIGGLGIYLVTQSVDRLLYERVENRNRNILIVHRNKV